MERRTALGVVAAAGLVELRGAEPYFAALEELCELTLPGAREAKAAWYIDTVMRHVSSTGGQMKRLLEMVEERCGSSFGKKFSECSMEQRDSVMRWLVEGEMRPSTEKERLWVSFKGLLVEAWAASAEAQRGALGYKGNRALDKFVGCTHEEHGA
jgi:hypothetical protein